MAEELLPVDYQDPELVMLRNNKTDGYNYRKRRDDDWLENYTLSRDNVITNRLTQRQTVNLPVMKTVLRTLIKDVDDLPAMYFENLDNDKEAEIFKNEYWKYVGEENKFELQDIVDKRQVFEFGRSYDQWQIVDGIPKFSIIDPHDMLVPRYNDTTNIDNNRWLIHTHIFVPLTDLETNEDYNQAAVEELRVWFTSTNGLIKSSSNMDMLTQKNRALAQIGVNDVDQPVLGETYVELTMHFVYHKEGDEELQLYLYVEAEGQKILMKKRLEDVIGVTKDHYWRNHFPYDSWADDVEKQDWYSDGVADIVRPTARVINVWWSQLVENRTLRSFGMNIYNGNLEGFNPQTWEAKPWGWYGLPVPADKSLSDVYQKLEIPSLDDSLEDMQFAVSMIEKATGATATQEGVQTENQITLGEVQLALGEAKERIKGMSKFYTQVWKERGTKFSKLLEAGSDKIDAVKIYKKGRITDSIYNREISPNDWKSEEGYRCKVWSQTEKDQQDQSGLQKTNAVKMNMPDNPIVDTVYKRKLLEFGDFTPDELNDAMKFEDQKRNAMMLAAQNPAMAGQPMPGGAQPTQQPIPAKPAQQPAAQAPQPMMAQ